MSVMCREEKGVSSNKDTTMRSCSLISVPEVVYRGARMNVWIDGDKKCIIEKIHTSFR